MSQPKKPNKFHDWMEKAANKPFEARTPLGKLWVIVRWPILLVVLLLFLLWVGIRIFVTQLFNMIADRFK